MWPEGEGTRQVREIRGSEPSRVVEGGDRRRMGWDGGAEGHGRGVVSGCGHWGVVIGMWALGWSLVVVSGVWSLGLVQRDRVSGVWSMGCDQEGDNWWWSVGSGQWDVNIGIWSVRWMWSVACGH